MKNKSMRFMIWIHSTSIRLYLGAESEKKKKTIGQQTGKG